MSAIIAFLGLRGTVVAGILTALLLAASGAAAWQFVRAEAAVLAERNAKADRRDAEADLKECEGANASIQFVEEARARFAAANEVAYREAAKRSAEALAAAERRRAEAARELAEWRRAWGTKSPTCAAALAATDKACPELGDY